MNPRRISLLAPVAVTLLLAALLPTTTDAATSPAWHAAQKVTLPAGGTEVPSGYLPALACASAGNCVAGGEYADASDNPQGLLLNEVKGTWTTPTTVKAPTGAAADPGITIESVSCATAGNCAAVGSYDDAAGDQEPFVDNEVSGVWQSAKEVTLPANALGSGQEAFVKSVACPSVGNCSAAGSYLDNTTTQGSQGFLLKESGGTWQGATELTLNAATNQNPFVSLSQIACSGTGNCVVAGSFINVDDVTRAIVVDEAHGTWGAAKLLQLPGNASAYAAASVSELTCVTNQCTVLGTYDTSSGAVVAATATETNFVWTGLNQLTMPTNTTSNPHVYLYGYGGISCASAGNCALGGQYRDAAGLYEGFVANEKNGTWAPASEVLLPAGAESAGQNGGVVAVSCAAAGQCRAGAAYLDASGSYQALVINETNGVWQRGTKVALPAGATSVGVDGGVYALVCATPNACTAVGSYLAPSTDYQGFTLEN